MSYKSTYDISCRLSKQLKLGLNHDGVALLEILKDLLRLSNGKSIESEDVVNLVIKLTQLKDFKIKKLVYLYLSFVTDDESDMWLQVMNSITNDLFEPSPILKKSSLLLLTDSQSLSSSLNERRLSLIEKSLRDSNNAVRRCATAGVTKFSTLAQNHCEKIDVSRTLESVNKMIYSDDDPSVIVQCVHCLHSSGVYDIENRLLLSLVERLGIVDTWTKAEIVNLFIQVVDHDKMSEEEIFQCLNSFDPYLDGKYPFYLSLICSCAMILVTRKFSAIFRDVVNKVVDFMLSHISLAPTYFQSVYLSMLESLSRFCPKKIEPHFKVFTPLAMDDPFVKITKMRLLGRACNKQSCSYIFKAVTSVMLTEKTWEIVEAAAEALFNLHIHLPEDCESFLICMFSHDAPMIFETSVVVLWRLVLFGGLNLKVNEFSFNCLIEGYSKMSSLDGKTAYFSLVSMLAIETRVVPVAAVMSAELTKWDDLESTAYKLLLLRFIHVLYFLSHDHVRAVLSNYVFKASKDSNPLIRRQTYAYLRAMKEDSGKLETFLHTVVGLRSTERIGKVSSVIVDINKMKGVSLLATKRKTFK